ncbi:MAG: EMC3/TMCO1 family protein [Candidatus Hermodarchaeota archaeon]
MFFLEDVGNLMFNLINLPMTILDTFPPSKPPLSSLFILLVAFSVSLFSTIVSRLMIDVDKLRRLTRETKKYNKLRMQMMKTADSKLKLKYERNADRMRKVQSELTMMNLKPLLITFIPLILVFGIMNQFYNVPTKEAVTIAHSLPAIIPFWLPEKIIDFPLLMFGRNTYLEGWGRVFVPYYLWWYFGGSLAFSSIMRKISGLQPD